MAAALAAESAAAGSEVSVLLTDDAEIAGFHRRYMGIPGPTDVMSWPAADAADTGFLGDVLISCETAARQAAELGHPVEREVCVLAVHGVLHLLGWDDQTGAEREAMQSRVDDIVDAISVMASATPESAR